MVATRKLIEKLSGGSIQKSELGTLLEHLGFAKLRGKGSHEVWGNKQLPDLHFVIATHTKEVPRYQLRKIESSLKLRKLI
jgi:predicted RNA binding protein YcfA (HicA-like mRNA interferase family)